VTVGIMWHLKESTAGHGGSEVGLVDFLLLLFTIIGRKYPAGSRPHRGRGDKNGLQEIKRGVVKRISATCWGCSPRLTGDKQVGAETQPNGTVWSLSWQSGLTVLIF